MKRIGLSLTTLLITVALWAVPAYPGWQTKTASDGSTVEVRLVGDEFCSYWESKDGKLMMEQADGLFVKSDKPLPTKEEFRARRTRARELRQMTPEIAPKGKRAPQGVGSRMLAPRGVVILVNFADSAMKEDHTNAVFDNWCNAQEGECTTNAYKEHLYGSAGQYFADQSNGAYRPHFDVIGPVTIPHELAYYGEQDFGEDGVYDTDDDGMHDMYMADFVIDAVLAAEEWGCDFSQYDADNDGWVDFVYFIYAGKGQAAGGGPETIWPHNSSLIPMLYYQLTHGESGYYYNTWEDKNIMVLDGKYINNYACSAELDYRGDLGGIGTMCHEFGHVMGLADYYDTMYGENYETGVTPGNWNIMDGGCYNGGGHCPPNYAAWDKFFFGWVDPVNLGNNAANCELHANGTAEYNVYQVNTSGKKQTVTTNQLNYYLENRQKIGWDEYLPGHGLCVWRVDYKHQIWNNNAPNNEAGNPRYTVAQISDSWEAIEGKDVTEVEETDGVVTFKYMGGTDPLDSTWINWQYYDNGKAIGNIGTQDGSIFYWGIMLPANNQEHNALTKVAIYERPDNNTQPITIDVYEGYSTTDADGNMQHTLADKLYTETVAPAAGDSFHIVTLADTVFFDATKGLWIILSEENDINPAITCKNTGDPNGRWVSLDGTTWGDLALDYSLDFTFMIRAYCENLEQPQEQGIENLSTKDQRQTTKILRDGQIFILRDGKAYNVLGIQTTND